MLAELEQSVIAERTRAGVKTARARGVKFGRKRKLTRAHITDARKKIATQASRPTVAEFYRVSRGDAISGTGHLKSHSATVG